MRSSLMSMVKVAGLIAALLACPACGPGIPGGPTMNNRVDDQNDPPPPEIQSNDILARDARTMKAKVKHILIGWKEIGGDHQDPRARKRSRAEADQLAVELLGRVRAGEPIEPLMEEFSEDPGSAHTGIAYDVDPKAGLVFEFKRLSLRLDVGESGLVLSEYGWHVIKRVE